jgi:hypothetical protein
MPETKKPALSAERLAAQAVKREEQRKLVELREQLREAVGKKRRLQGLDYPDLPEFKHGDHVCLSYHSERYLLDFLTQYVVEGLDQGERCFCVQKPHILKLLQQDLEALGINTAEEQKKGSLELRTEQEVYYPSGNFDPAVMMNLLVRSLDESLKNGFTGFRTAGDLSWAMKNPAIYQTMIAYERMVNQCYPEKGAIGLCQYPIDDCPVDLLQTMIEHHTEHFVETTAPGARKTIH